ncbi:MAG: ROK family transcriptional regulator [Candidatus Caldatribacteriota bacterium]|jgi:predicted NBD/HSP70 family sugar kinase/biotin operon repressor|nr:ROK family transcriptional regulator [Atribacterota bacterium]
MNKSKTNLGNSITMKKWNLSRIFKTIYQQGPISRIKLTEITGCSPGTVSNHVKTLIKKGFVVETNKGISSGGRKPVKLIINPNKAYIFSIEIEVNRIKIVMFDLKVKPVEMIIIPIKHKGDYLRTFEHVFYEMDNMIKRKNLRLEDFLGIGVAVPGLIDKIKGVLEFAPNLGWKDVSISKIFKEKYDLPVILNNEAKAAAIGERGSYYPQVNNMVFVSINEGIGCGLYINGSLYRGASGNAGEFGHITINTNGTKCHCGNRGCWEIYASENYIVNRYLELSVNKKKLSKEEIYILGKNDDKTALKIFQEIGRNIGVGLVNIINGLSPELLVIGGGIVEIKDYIYEEIIKKLEESCLSVSCKKTDIKFSKLGNMAAVYGMADLIINKRIKFI